MNTSRGLPSSRLESSNAILEVFILGDGRDRWKRMSKLVVVSVVDVVARRVVEAIDVVCFQSSVTCNVRLLLVTPSLFLATHV